MFEYIKKYEKNSIIINILMVLVSILLIINPAGVLNMVTIVFGIDILADGLFNIAAYFGTDKSYRIYSGKLFEGIIVSTAGILILLNKSLLISILPMVIGIWIIVRSIMKLQLSLNLKSMEVSKWIWVLVSAVISLLLGILIIMNPFGTMITITILAGIFLLISSITDLIESVFIIKTLK